MGMDRESTHPGNRFTGESNQFPAPPWDLKVGFMISRTGIGTMGCFCFVFVMCLCPIYCCPLPLANGPCGVVEFLTGLAQTDTCRRWNVSDEAEITQVFLWSCFDINMTGGDDLEKGGLTIHSTPFLSLAYCLLPIWLDHLESTWDTFNTWYPSQLFTHFPHFYHNTTNTTQQQHNG